MTKSKKLFVTALLALSVFGVLFAAGFYSEVARETILGFFSAIGYCLTVYAFYKFLGDSKPTAAPKSEAYFKSEKAYDYESDKEFNVDEICAETKSTELSGN